MCDLSKNLEITKFRKECIKLREYLRVGIFKINFFIISLDACAKNEYAKCISEVCCWEDDRKANFGSWYNDGKTDSSELEIAIAKVEDLKFEPKNKILYTNLMLYSLFWNLFAIKEDQDIYEQEIQNVRNLASSLDVSEAMFDDCITVIEYIMGGNKLSGNTDLDLRTDECKGFFFHEK